MGYFDLVRVCKGKMYNNHHWWIISFPELGDEFCKIGVREPQETASKAFCQFGEYHRAMEKYGIQMLKKTKPILKDLGTYLSKVKKKVENWNYSNFVSLVLMK